MRPVLETTQAPAFFTEALEDHEREYWAIWHPLGVPRPAWARLDTVSVFAEPVDVTPGATLCGPRSLGAWLKEAAMQGALFIALRQPDGTELKRWPVTA